LKLLKHLRGILLQHSVLLRRRFLCHAIWGDPLFATPEYAEFAERLVTGLIDGEEPHLIQIERANLLVAGELQTLGRTRLRAAGLALPAITDSDLDPRRPTAPAEPPSGSGTPESADPPVYEMVRTHGTVTDLWHEWSVG
jgi:hypothetical protein